MADYESGLRASRCQTFYLSPCRDGTPRLSRGPALTISVRREMGYALVTVAGEIDIATVPRLRVGGRAGDTSARRAYPALSGQRRWLAGVVAPRDRALHQKAAVSNLENRDPLPPGAALTRLPMRRA